MSCGGMPTPSRIHRRAAAGRLVAAVEPIDDTSVYVTDEVFLYRLAGVTARGTDEVVELEDCYGLDVVQVLLSDLRARRLRVVTPAIS